MPRAPREGAAQDHRCALIPDLRVKRGGEGAYPFPDLAGRRSAQTGQRARPIGAAEMPHRAQDAGGPAHGPTLRRGVREG